MTITFVKYYAISCQTCLRFRLLGALVPLMENFGRKVLEVVWMMNEQGLQVGIQRPFHESKTARKRAWK